MAGRIASPVAAGKDAFELIVAAAVDDGDIVAAAVSVAAVVVVAAEIDADVVVAAEGCIAAAAVAEEGIAIVFGSGIFVGLAWDHATVVASFGNEPPVVLGLWIFDVAAI